MKSFEKHTDPSGHRQRLRERFSKAGREGLLDYELLELLLTYSIPRVDTKSMAKALLIKFGTFIGVLQQPSEQLITIKGIGPKTAFFLKVVQACLTRCNEIEVERQLTIKGPADIVNFTRLHLGNRTNECIYAFYLNDSHSLVYHTEVTTGTVDRAPFYPREIFKPAFTYNATNIILLHNHPEGLPVPSENDMEITRKLEEIAAPLGIKLLDHMIVTKLQSYSIKTGKLL